MGGRAAPVRIAAGVCIPDLAATQAHAGAAAVNLGT
jgi:hypothetical protein